jgi:phosphoglycerate transporter family protein
MARMNSESAPESSAPAGTVQSSSFLFRLFRPDPPAAHTLTDPIAVASEYHRYRIQILTATMIGYAAYYFVRKNLSIAMPVMEKDLGISKSDLGLFLTLHGVIYGVSKFFNGMLGDRCNARMFMVTGLVLCAGLNIVFGFSSTITAMGLIWMLNGWFQGMGFPPCARLLTHWFPPRVLATRMSLWNTSHSIGAGLVVILCGYVVAYGWRNVFFVPSAIALLCAAYLWYSIKDTPESLGLPEVEGTGATNSAAHRDKPSHDSRYWMKRVFVNPYIWIFAFANFFVYTVRYAIFDWSPSILSQARGLSLKNAGWVTAAFEISGIFGMLTFGWITDRFFGGRSGRTCLLCMAACTVSLFVFWNYPTQNVGFTVVIMCLLGFFIYGPQALVGIAVANLATKHAAATAVGLTGIFGYLSTIFSGWGFGALVERHGWHAGFQEMFVFSIAGTLLFALAWFAPPHGYGSREP